MMNVRLSTQGMCVRYLALPLLLALLTACASTPPQHAGRGKNSWKTDAPGYRPDDDAALLANLKAAEQQADENGRAILVTGRNMAIDDPVIVKGSCWDFIHAVYNRSGYPNTRTGRATVFKGTKANGPYAEVSLIKPGDWLYYVNHSYGGIEHSGIFITWLERKTRNALILSYGGEQRNEPARYLPYDISNVYNIIRPAEKTGVPPQQLSRNPEKITP